MKNPRLWLWIICPQARRREFKRSRLSEECLLVRLKKSETVGGKRWRQTRSQVRFSPESIRWTVALMTLFTKARLRRSMVIAMCRASAGTIPTGTSTSIGGTMTGIPIIASSRFATFSISLATQPARVLFLIVYAIRQTFCLPQKELQRDVHIFSYQVLASPMRVAREVSKGQHAQCTGPPRQVFLRVRYSSQENSIQSRSEKCRQSLTQE